MSEFETKFINSHPGVITKELVLEYSGELELCDVREIILRDQKLQTFDHNLMEELGNLELLSLSHNEFDNVLGFNFLNLIEINLSFNQIDSLIGLECPNLQKLFISHNKLTSLYGIDQYPKLIELSAYSNQIVNFNDSLNILKKLSCLKKLDLGGNPCSSSYNSKNKIISELITLEYYNGDLISDYMRNNEDLNVDFDNDTLEPDLKLRPSTAPAPLVHRPPLLGGIKLFRNDELNKNEILMEYLANGAVSFENGSVDDYLRTIRAEIRLKEHNHKKEKVSFVSRIRGTDPIPPPPEQTTDDLLLYEPNVDPSNSSETISNLLNYINVLKDEIKKLNTELEETKKIITEDQELRVENANMYILKKENDEIRERLKKLEDHSHTDELVKENHRLRDALSNLTERYNLLYNQTQSTAESLHLKRPTTAINILDEYDQYDSEISELIRKNESNLNYIKSQLGTIYESNVESSPSKPTEIPHPPPPTQQPAKQRQTHQQHVISSSSLIKNKTLTKRMNNKVDKK